MKKQIHIPNSELRRPVSIRSELPNLPSDLVKAAEAHRRQPGILDRIKLCESSETAHTMFYKFLDSANNISQKTLNRAQRLLSTLDFPLP